MDQPDSPLGAYRPLTGLKVIELASVLAGPLAGTFLLELGAEVIKVEHPRSGGDVTRQWRAQGESPLGVSAYYAAANGPKKVVFLDLSVEDDRAALDEWLKGADILLQNFKASSLDRLGLAPSQIAKKHPGLIHLHLQGFLHEPDRPGYDMVVQAETGLMALNGEPGRSPFRMPVAMMDILAAHQLRSAALLALWEREKDNMGSYVQVWLDASGLSALVNRGTEHLVAGSEPQALGPAHPQIAPYGESFACACGSRIVLAVGNDRQFQALCGAIQRPGLAEDARFSTNPSRVRNRKELAKVLAQALALIDGADLLELGRLRGIPMGRLNSVSEALLHPTGKAMTAEFSMEGQTVRHMRQVAFHIQRNGKLST